MPQKPRYKKYFKWRVKNFKRHFRSQAITPIISGSFSFLEPVIEVAKKEQERLARAEEYMKLGVIEFDPESLRLWTSEPTAEENARMIAEARFYNNLYKAPTT